MDWEYELQHSIKTVEDLAPYVTLNSQKKKDLEAIIRHHPMSVTRYYMSLINWDDPDDPIRKMVIPSKSELDLHGLYDTSGEAENTKMPGLQHKYNETVLLIATNRCPTYCRHCFRKRMVGMSDNEVVKRLHEALDYIRGTEKVTNVLVSGGDPFILPNNVINDFLENLCKIDHLKFIRFGTRVPVTFPDRILLDKNLIEILTDYDRKKKIQITTHFNHPREITDKSSEAIQMLLRVGIPVHNQTVLLRGVNDHADIMTELMNGLTSIGITPFYVFQCRPTMRVKTAFQVPLYIGCKIIEETRKHLDGYAKRFRYVMSHVTGKIEILGIFDHSFLFKYHQAKSIGDHGRIFKKGADLKAGWLDDL